MAAAHANVSAHCDRNECRLVNCHLVEVRQCNLHAASLQLGKAHQWPLLPYSKSYLHDWLQSEPPATGHSGLEYGPPAPHVLPVQCSSVNQTVRMRDNIFPTWLEPLDTLPSGVTDMRSHSCQQHCGDSFH